VQNFQVVRSKDFDGNFLLFLFPWTGYKQVHLFDDKVVKYHCVICCFVCLWLGLTDAVLQVSWSVVVPRLLLYYHLIITIIFAVIISWACCCCCFCYFQLTVDYDKILTCNRKLRDDIFYLQRGRQIFDIQFNKVSNALEEAKKQKGDILGMSSFAMESR